MFVLTELQITCKKHHATTKKGYAKKKKKIFLKNADNAATSKEELHNTKSETSFAKVAFFNAHSKGAKES